MTNYFRTAAAQDQKIAFLAAAALGDGTAWLAMADWYEENGDAAAAEKYRRPFYRDSAAAAGEARIVLIAEAYGLLRDLTAFHSYSNFLDAADGGYVPTVTPRNDRSRRLTLILRALGHRVFDGKQMLEPLGMEDQP